jgi:transcriptional regulator with XRE-family HTH domain
MVSDQIRILCAHLKISQAKLAKASGMSPQNFNNKLRKNSLTPDELKQIAKSVGCRYIGAFILPDGEEIEY